MKEGTMKITSTLIPVLLMLTACTMNQSRSAVTPRTTGTPPADMPNPASVFCEAQGYRSEIRIADDGSQTGYCIFPDGSECDEWMYYRGECGPSGSSPQPTPEIMDGWKTYRNESFGYSFQYPADAQMGTDDNPLKSLSISGPGMGEEFWGISHPSDREEFRPPEGVDLLQWLTDHYLAGEKRMPDTQIAGTLAIHYRHDRSPQSPADDRYYFARDGQLYLVLIGHGSETEDWEVNNRFLQSIRFDEDVSIASAPTAIPTALPIEPADYQGWWTYTHPVYGFSIMLPEDWVVEETTTFDPFMSGHLLTLHPNYGKESIRMTFRRAGEDFPLWPTGVGSGEFIPQGTLDIAGEPARRILFVCPNGEITEIWYHDLDNQPNITRGDLEFGFIYSNSYCEPGYSLGGKVQRWGEMIIASLKVP
jgi:putative hemolysin